MSTPQPSPELTTRDVLQQIDHRLGLIETDVRENHTKIEAKIDAFDRKFENLKAKLKSKYANCAASSTANLTWLSAWSSPLGCR
ncbi:MAG: hypothetical protein J4F35_23515 [Candidatus Latescibacteria bacterium]|nr:hypothetical protein [Candidatus Latescibacterota bacterium]